MLISPNTQHKQTQYTTHNEKTILFGSLLAVAACGITSCSDDPDPFEGDAVKLEYNAGNARQWGNYMAHTALLLKNDAETLYNQWATQYTKHENGQDVAQGGSYATFFKTTMHALAMAM